MAKDHIPQFDTTAGNNTDIDNVDIAEGCRPSGINNAIRELMADIASSIQVRAISSATTLDLSDHGKLIDCDASSSGFTVTLPAASSSTGLTVFVKKTDSSGNAVTVDANSSETIDGSTTYTLDQQYDVIGLRCDGTEWWLFATGQDKYLALDDTPDSFSGDGSKFVRVNSGETALEHIAPTFLLLTDAPSSYSGDGGKFVRVNSGETAVEFDTAEFTELTDTPSSYSGNGNKVVSVNSGETALEFTDVASQFTGLTDTPSSFTGEAGKSVRVNSGETALEYYSPESTAAGIQLLGIFS